MTTRNKIILGITAGALFGSVAALLVAPKTGKETRQIVTSGAGRFASQVASQFGRKAGHYWGSLQQKIGKAEGNGVGSVQ